MTRTPLKALVVEDEPNVVDFIRRTMVVLGHDCICATNVQDAREALRSGGFDYILLDLKIPALPDGLFPSIDGGMAVLAEIGDQPGNGHVPIFAMTSHTDQGFDMAVKLTNMGVSRCIPKPLDDKPLSQIIREVLGSHKKRPALSGKAGRRKRGHPPCHDPNKDRQLMEEWAAVRGKAGMTRKEFCASKSIPLKAFIQAQDRFRKQQISVNAGPPPEA